jgi:hypothetical protein
MGLIVMLAGCSGNDRTSSSEAPAAIDEQRVSAAHSVILRACQPQVGRQSVMRAVDTLLDAYRRIPDQPFSETGGDDNPSGMPPSTVADLVHVAAVELRACSRYPALGARLAQTLPDNVVIEPPQVPGVPEPGRGS